MLLPVLFTRCPFGTDHWFFERWCQCSVEGQGPVEPHGDWDSLHGSVFDLKRWEKARQGPEGYRPRNTDVHVGKYVQPKGLALGPPLAWKVVGFEPEGRNPKYRIVVEYPISGDRLVLDNLPRNTCPPRAANNPKHYDSLSQVCRKRSTA